MISGNGKYICDVCANYAYCKDSKKFKSIADAVKKLGEAEGISSIRLVCDKIKTTRYT